MWCIWMIGVLEYDLHNIYTIVEGHHLMVSAVSLDLSNGTLDSLATLCSSPVTGWTNKHLRG